MRQLIKDTRDWFRNDPGRRDHIYFVAQAALAIFVIYGLMTAEYANAWLLLVVAVLNISRKNVY